MKVKIKMALQGYLSAGAAAKAIGVDVSTIHRWATKEKVQSTYVGSRLFVLASSVAAITPMTQELDKALSSLAAQALAAP